MSRSSDGYYRSGPRRRNSDGYSGGFSDYADSYGSRRSSRDSYHERRSSSRGGRSHGGRGLMVNPWEGGVVPGSGGGRGAGVPISGDIVASINQLSRMDNPESELALNILNAVLSKEDSGWGGGRGRDWEGHSHKRRMDWDNQYSYNDPLGDGILPTPHVPPRKMPRRDAPYGTAYSWGVVGGFSAQPIRGKGRRGTKKTIVTTKKPKPATTATTKTTKTTEKSKTSKPEDEAKEGEEKKEKAEGEEKKEEKEKEGEEKEEGEGKDAEAEGEAEEGGEAADGDKATEKKTAAKDKKKDECPVPVSYLRCHLCQMNKFNSASNFMDHIRSKKHRRMIGYYGEKIAATEKLLKAQSWLKSQRNIVSMVKQKGKITRCVCCECPIKGGRWTHIHIREHMLLFHFTKCFTCKLKFMTRSDLEQHKLTTGHMKAQYTLDQSAKERYQRWVSKTQKESNIPELKHSEDFHETVKQMFMNNLDTQAWNKDTIPIYDPARPAGMNHLVKHSQYVCTVCPQKVSQTAWEAKEHCKTQDHYEHFVKHLKDMEEKAAQKEKGDASDKENDESEANAKKDDDGKTETKKTEEKEGEKEDKEKESASAKKEEEEEEEEHEDDDEGGEEDEEEEEQEEEEEEEEENGMKDMENMEVIDEEGDHDGNEEEEEEEEGGEGEEDEEEEGGEMADMEEVGEDMEDIGEDLEDMGEEEEEEEGGGEEEKEEEEEEEEEKGDSGDKSSSSTTKAAPAEKAQTRSSRGRIIRESRRGKD